MGRSIPPRSTADYRYQASLCRSVANRTSDERVRSEMLDLAMRWVMLADLSEKGTVLPDEALPKDQRT